MKETEKKKRGRPPKKKAEEKKKKSIKSKLTDERIKFLFGLFLFFFTIYLGIAFISYLFTWSIDMSMFDLNFFEFISQEKKPANSMGKLGAYLSKIFIYTWFGISAFGFIFIFPLWALKLLKVKITKFKSIISKTLFIIVWTSLFLAYIFGATKFNIGGVFGYEITQWLNSIIGKFGTGFVLFISALTFIFFVFENSYSWIKQFSNNLYKAKDFKTAYKTTKSSVSFFNKKEKHEQEEKSNNEEDDDDFADIFGGNTVADTDKNNPEVSEKQKYILKADGTKMPINKNTNDIGFDVENTLNNIEETVEQGNALEDKLYDRNGLEVHTNQDLIGEAEQMEDYNPTKTLSNFKLPPLNILIDHVSDNYEVSKQELLENRSKIVNTLKNYKIEIKKIKATVGPTVTLYEIIPAPGIRISKIKNLEDDIALNLAALGIRIIAPMPGRGTIGIEVPNKNPAVVSIKSVLSSLKFQKSKYELPIALGKTISNETYVFDLTKMPHLLIAGATGQGKSVGLNTILASILYKKHPALVKFVLIDPKKVELVVYEKIEKHYLAQLPDAEEPIVTENKKVVNTLNSLNIEMDNRYQLLKNARVRNIKEYNEKFIKRRLNPNKGHDYMPYIVIVVDEFADLIMTAGKEVELPLTRLAQLARAVGIHLIVATQRPSANIITGVIKANFPARISFRVASMMDSRTILDTPGANQLVGRGDMLVSRGSDLVRLQCAFIDTPELEKITDFISDQKGFPEAFQLPEPESEDDKKIGKVDLKKRDKLFEDSAKLIVLNQQGSTSLIQRKLAIGYNRAGRIMDQLEAAGIVGPAQGSKPREVYYSDIDSLTSLFDSLNNMT
ncbi:MAG: DNA translocase FtsK [Bacteroidota bacterium]|nr:DNA translocase FtsK [Bacteroidota bacterium]